MPRIPRRLALGLLTLGATVTGGIAAVSAFARTAGSGNTLGIRPGIRRPQAMPGENPIEVENRKPGNPDWQPRPAVHPASTDRGRQIQGYASATSINLGEAISFHVAVTPQQSYEIAIYRLGWYRGAGARLITTSPVLSGIPQPVPPADPTTGMIECGWPVSWTLTVPQDWVSGVYVAVFTAQSKFRSYTPFVVRNDARVGGLCVVLPFTTYQAYNVWPSDRQTGKSLYYGFTAGKRDYEVRARHVSFDRPYAGTGTPNGFTWDIDFIQWAERNGYDVTYASNLDVHAGRLKQNRYRGLVFCGHDEYWSQDMRQFTERAVARGTHAAFLSANNIYWHVRIGKSTDGRADRVVICHKTEPDPQADHTGPTTTWRSVDPNGSTAEQRLLGIQYNGIVKGAHPLVVQAADHWFWAGCRVTNGTKIPKVVGGEADGLTAKLPRPVGVASTVLAASPYLNNSGRHLVQNTHVYETLAGTIVFAAGSLNWTLSLNKPDQRDPRIEQATANLFDRMLDRPTNRANSHLSRRDDTPGTVMPTPSGSPPVGATPSGQPTVSDPSGPADPDLSAQPPKNR